jgi:hypothetical protein
VQFFAFKATAFALTLLGRASIPAAEQGFQIQGRADKVIPRAIVISIRKEFESILFRSNRWMAVK